MTYLKKTKMYELVQGLAEVDIDIKLAQCEYRFHRGMEWLKLHNDSCIYELCSSGAGSYLALNKYVWDDDLQVRKEVFRHVYNGWGKMEIAL